MDKEKKKGKNLLVTLVNFVGYKTYSSSYIVGSQI